MINFAGIFICIGLFGCTPDKATLAGEAPLSIPDSRVDKWINPAGLNIESRFLLPDGYQRVAVNPASYQDYLRKLPLKHHGALVKYYDGSSKPNRNVYDAVVNLPIGNRDLHQCADAVMRLRGEYLFEKEEYDQIHFNFTNGFRVDYKEWMKGNRIEVNGNNVSWVLKKKPSNTYNDFWKYMEIVFSYAGTLSLDEELKSVGIKDMQIGDVFIRGGSPGHAVIVVDLIEDKSLGKKKFLLAQSYMPAQEIQVLKNPTSRDGSPWYNLAEGMDLKTPEWSFTADQLKRFE